MSLKPQLVKLDDGKIGMQVRLGQFTATAPLPDQMATWNEEQLRPFFDQIVPEMTKNLVRVKQEYDRKFRKKAAKL